MQIVRSHFITKSNDTINQVVKNTSCSHGWLRLVVQMIFGAITVASFVLILHMAMQRPKPTEKSRCGVNNCRVECLGVEFARKEEEGVISTVMEMGLNCKKIIMSLRNLAFINNTMPLHWMSRMPSNINVLNILGGNLHHIPSTAFVGQSARNIRSLTLEGVTLSQWTSTTFVGLSSLRRFSIKNCVFGNILRNALSAIDNTIDTLTITHSGKWNPALITGQSPSDNTLNIVDFSFNDFGNILNSDTFKGLRSCKILYLNSCKITSIGTGAFDPLTSIDLLFLSDNMLHTVPTGLFQTFLAPNRHKPRIHLENNPWECNCLQEDLIQMSKSGLLTVDTVCQGPRNMFGKSFTELQDYCQNSSIKPQVTMDFISKERWPIVSEGSALTSFDHPCFYGEKPSFNGTLNVISPIAHYQCKNISISQDFWRSSRGVRSFKDLTESNWLNPTFILNKKKYSVIQVSSSVIDLGILWYQSSCPNELYCLNTVPNFLRVYYTDADTQFTFCSFDVSKFTIPMDNCVTYNLSTPTDTRNIYYSYFQNTPLLYIGVSLLCLSAGAMCVYMVIRQNPILLKGSKRLLFVKHRNVDALVLPPKVPLRNKNSFQDEKIFTMPDDGKLYVNHFVRSNSSRSDKSNTPTYISAMQPTDSQLAEWRIRHHFDKSPSIISISSDISTVSWTSDCTSAEITTNVVYESMK